VLVRRVQDCRRQCVYVRISDGIHPDGSENYDAYPVEVSAEGEEYKLKIVSRVREGQRTYYPEDWHYWCAMISITDECQISFKTDIEK